ncbi:MAG TPA: hypothetical protein VL172_13140 [Kofleriaceae bacterium]|nr:hypothetical protein [Kofleriaceae bacterium]
MPRWQRSYLVLCAAVIGFALAYFACDFGGWTRLAYDPWARSWRWTDRPTPFDSLYWGTILWGLAGAAAFAAVAWLACRRAGRELSARWNLLAAAWALTAFAFIGLYFTWNLWPF